MTSETRAARPVRSPNAGRGPRRSTRAVAVTALLTLLAAAATDVPVLLVLGAVLAAWLSIALSTGAGM